MAEQSAESDAILECLSSHRSDDPRFSGRRAESPVADGDGNANENAKLARGEDNAGPASGATVPAVMIARAREGSRRVGRWANALRPAEGREAVFSARPLGGARRLQDWEFAKVPALDFAQRRALQSFVAAHPLELRLNLAFFGGDRAKALARLRERNATELAEREAAERRREAARRRTLAEAAQRAEAMLRGEKLFQTKREASEAAVRRAEEAAAVFDEMERRAEETSRSLYGYRRHATSTPSVDGIAEERTGERAEDKDDGEWRMDPAERGLREGAVKALEYLRHEAFTPELKLIASTVHSRRQARWANEMRGVDDRDPWRREYSALQPSQRSAHDRAVETALETKAYYDDIAEKRVRAKVRRDMVREGTDYDGMYGERGRDFVLSIPFGRALRFNRSVAQRAYVQRQKERRQSMERAATRVQAAFRGFHLRRMLAVERHEAAKRARGEREREDAAALARAQEAKTLEQERSQSGRDGGSRGSNGAETTEKSQADAPHKGAMGSAATAPASMKAGERAKKLQQHEARQREIKAANDLAARETLWPKESNGSKSLRERFDEQERLKNQAAATEKDIKREQLERRAKAIERARQLRGVVASTSVVRRLRSKQ
jgi:hypothetical protein